MPAVGHQFGLGAEATKQLVFVEDDLSTAYGGPFSQLGSSSIRFVILTSPSTLSALETARGPSFTATTTRVPMSVQRKAPEWVQNVSPIKKSQSSISVRRLTPIVARPAPRAAFGSTV